MAITYWRRPDASGTRLRSGDFGKATNWSRGQVPGGDDTVVLSAGRYTVTVSEPAAVGTLAIAERATLFVSQGDPMSFSVSGDATNAGTIRLGGASFNVGGTLTNTGTIEGQSFTSGDWFRGGTVVNSGVIDTYGRGAWIVQTTIDNQASGVIRSDVGFGMHLIGSLHNAGLVEAIDAPLDFRLFETFVGTVDNMIGTALAGGHWRVSGAGSIELPGTRLDELRDGADVVLDGVDASMSVSDGTVVRQIDDTLLRISAGAALHVLGGRDFGGEASLDLFGTLELGGGTLASSDLDSFAGSSLTGYGTVAGEAVLNGNVVAEGGTLRFTDRVILDGSVSGSGTVALTGGDARIGEGASLTVDTLVIENGVTRLDSADVRVATLALRDATLDSGRLAFTFAGALDLADGRVAGAAIRLTGDATTSTGTSEFAGAVANAGTIAVSEGRLLFGGKLTGSGDVVAADGATVAFGAGAAVGRAQGIALDGASTLEIAAPRQFAGGVSSFGAGDTITLAGLSAATTRLRWTPDEDGVGGTLRLVGETTRAVLHFDDGQYARRDFSTFDFASGVLGLTYQPRTSASLDEAAMFGDDAHLRPQHAWAVLDPLHTDGHVALV